MDRVKLSASDKSRIASVQISIGVFRPYGSVEKIVSQSQENNHIFALSSISKWIGRQNRDEPKKGRVLLIFFRTFLPRGSAVIRLNSNTVPVVG